MDDRAHAAEVAANLSSTSEKVRALARAGYRRTEISKLLGIRYQHVRKVLLDAGITDGLMRDVSFERPPVAVPVTSAPRPNTRENVLLQAGFRPLGLWQLSGDRELALDALAPPEPGVYAFVVDGVVRYIGLTLSGLRTRMDHYRRGHRGQRTNARVKELITAALEEGKTVQVLIATPDPQQWNGLPINTSAGLEAGLIRMIRPEWNKLGALD